MMTNDMNNTVYFAVIDAESSATSADEAPYDYYYGDTAVSIASRPIAINSEYSIVIDTESSIVSVATNEAHSVSNDSPATVTTTTQVYSTPSSSFESSINYVTFSAVADAVARTTTSYTSSSSYNNNNNNDGSNDESLSTIHDRIFSIMKTTAFHELPLFIHDGIISADNDAVSSAAVMILTTAVKLMTNDMNTAIFFAVIDAESVADVTNTTTSYALPSYDIDTESSDVSIADEATSTVTKTPTVSCHSSNDFSLTLRFESSRQFDQITSVFPRLMSLHRTLHLIIT